MVLRDKSVWGLTIEETCSQWKGPLFRIDSILGGRLIVKKLAVLFADFLVFISSLVVTATFSRFLLSLLTGMALNAQRWHEAFGVVAASSVCSHPSPRLSQQHILPPRMRTLLISVPGTLGRLWGKCHGMISVDFPTITFSLLPTGLRLTHRLHFVFR